MMHNWLQFPVEEASIGRTLKSAGYDTGYIGKWHLDAFLEGDQANIYNIFTPPGPRRQGFDFWYAHGCNHKHFRSFCMNTTGGLTDLPDTWQIDHETDMAIDYVNDRGGVRDPEKPFCLFLSWSPPHTTGPYPYDGPQKREARKFDRLRYYGGHAPQYHYQAPPEFEAPYRGEDLPVRENAQAYADEYRHCAPGYFGAVDSMDENFGRLMDALEAAGLTGNTVVVLTADHGDMLGSHGMFTKDVWYEESIGIPLVVRCPGQIPAGQVTDQLLSTVDFLPTLLGLLGVEVPPGRHGKDLSPVLRGDAEPIDHPIFLAHNCGSPHGLVAIPDYPEESGRFWRGVRTKDFTYVIVDATEESQYLDPDRFMQPLPKGKCEVLYDLTADPQQIHPIYRGQKHDAMMDILQGQVAAWLDELGDPFLEEKVRPAHGLA